MTENERHIYLEDIPLDQALQTLFELGKRDLMPAEEVPLAEAVGRITAEAIWAKLSSPHYHASAMDGYALHAAATVQATETRPVTLRLGESAFPVNTGDPMPAGTDAVVMIEQVEQLASHEIRIRAALAPRQHVRLLGEDMVATELVLPANHKIRPVDLGAVAGCGYASVKVRRPPQVIIIPTGSELVPITHVPQAGEIIEYNSLVLGAQVLEVGGHARVTGIIGDSADQLENALRRALAEAPDLILVLSGSSAGSHDYTATVIQKLGSLAVHGVAVRPGHPVIIGVVDNTPLIGVPGYPVSAALTGELFVQPLLGSWLGVSPPLEDRPRIQAVTTRKLTSPMGDDEFVRVSLAQVGDRLLAVPLSHGAGVITSLVRADGLAHIPRFSEGVDVGEPLEVILYQRLHLVQQTILAMGSHDPMLDLLAQFVASRFAGRRFVSANVGSLGGLIALRRGEAHLAGVHLLDSATGSYNVSYIKKYLPDVEVELVRFARREQGLIVAKDNPLGILGLEDLPRLRYVNRQRGAGTRVLLDYELGKRGIEASQITGYEHEEYTHLAVAAAVASGMADSGLGVRRAAVAMGLGFVPVGWEQYDLVIPKNYLPHVVPLLEILRSTVFQAEFDPQWGYDVTAMGQIVALS